MFCKKISRGGGGGGQKICISVDFLFFSRLYGEISIIVSSLLSQSCTSIIWLT